MFSLRNKKKNKFELSSEPPIIWSSGPGCSKQTMSLINVSLCQYFLLKKCEKLCITKASLIFSTKISVRQVMKL